MSKKFQSLEKSWLPLVGSKPPNPYLHLAILPYSHQECPACEGVRCLGVSDQLPLEKSPYAVVYGPSIS